MTETYVAYVFQVVGASHPTTNLYWTNLAGQDDQQRPDQSERNWELNVMVKSQPGVPKVVLSGDLYDHDLF